MMIRLETLESLVESLQTLPLEDAEQLFHRLRAAKGTDCLSNLVVETSTGDDCASNRTNASAPEIISGGSSQAGPDIDLTSTIQSPVLARKHIASDEVPLKQSIERQTPVISEIFLPDRSLLIRGTEAFFSSSLLPFDLFSKEEITKFLSLVYPETGPIQHTDFAALACLAAIAAVGARSTRAALDKDTPQTMYNVARSNFEAVVKAKPLDAVKCCVMLAMYNLISQSSAALIYVGVLPSLIVSG